MRIEQMRQAFICLALGFASLVIASGMPYENLRFFFNACFKGGFTGIGIGGIFVGIVLLVSDFEKTSQDTHEERASQDYTGERAK